MQLMLRRLWIQITSDRKRFGLLCAMLLLGMLLWGRIIVTSNLPRTAVADPVTDGGPKPLTIGAPPKTPDKDNGPARRISLARTPLRDPLLINDEHFPKPTSVELLDEDDPKFGQYATENVKQAEARLTEELRVLVGRFTLEGVMKGRPMAVINGRTYRLHSWIPAIDDDDILFQLIEVGDRSVILECEGRRFKLNMNYPGIEER